MSLLDQARNKQGDGATAWKPEEKGEGVEGTVISVTYQESDYQPGVMIPTVTLEQADGAKVRVMGFRSVLRKEIEQENPQPGDLMAAVYMGTEKLKTGKFAGKPVHVYRVVVQKATAAAKGADSSAPRGFTAEEADKATSDEIPF
jgi:hypothetical protein